MTRELFNSLLCEQRFEEVEVTDDFLDKLQTVIDFYPGIEDLDADVEKEMVGLVGFFGKGIILDMYGAAAERESLLKKKEELRARYEEALRKIDEKLERLEEGEE